MAAGTYLASTVVLGLLAAGVFYAAVNGRAWKRYAPQVLSKGRRGGLASDSRDWILGFVVVTVLAIAGLVGVLESGAGASVVIFAGAAVAIVGFLIVGTYTTARSRGHPHAYAVGEAVGVLGAVVLVAMVVNLLTRFGP